MTQIPSFAPGCFGSALAYQEHHSFCRACVFREPCAPMHRANLQALRERFGIVPGKQKERIAQSTSGDMLGLPKKVQELVDKIDRCGIKVTEKLANNENPFEHAIAFMKITCHLLLRLSRPVTRSDLVMAFSAKLAWKTDTATAHARMAIQALKHIGAIDDNDGQITLRRG